MELTYGIDLVLTMYMKDNILGDSRAKIYMESKSSHGAGLPAFLGQSSSFWTGMLRVKRNKLSYFNHHIFHGFSFMCSFSF